MEKPLDGKEIRRIRASLDMKPAEFALLMGVTIRTVALWESDVVVPSRITAMVIRATAERAGAAASTAGAGDLRRSSRGRTRRPDRDGRGTRKLG